MKVLHVDQASFNQLKESEKPVLLDFFAPWCGPCKLLSPIVDRLAEEHEEYVFAKVNVDEEGALADAFGIRSVPTLVVLKGGRETARRIGAANAAGILSLLES